MKTTMEMWDVNTRVSNLRAGPMPKKCASIDSIHNKTDAWVCDTHDKWSHLCENRPRNWYKPENWTVLFSELPLVKLEKMETGEWAVRYTVMFAKPHGPDGEITRWRWHRLTCGAPNADPGPVVIQAWLEWWSVAGNIPVLIPAGTR